MDLTGGYKAFAAIICVTDVELWAVQRMFDWKPYSIDGDEQIYYEAFYTREDGQIRIVAAKQDEMGMTAAAALSMKMIYEFRPKYLIMAGIAAGMGEATIDGQMYGDVVLASSVWNCSNGKYVSPNQADIVFGDVGFISRPSQIEMDEGMIKKYKEILETVETGCYVHVGPLASGACVVANKSVLNKQVRDIIQDTKALEMEGYGVAYAAKCAGEPRPMPIIAKSICDFADNQKDDKYQKFAAYTSCEIVRYMIKHVLE